MRVEASSHGGTDQWHSKAVTEVLQCLIPKPSDLEENSSWLWSSLQAD